MRKSLSISLSQKLARELTKLMKDEGWTRSEVVQLALREFLIQRRLDSLRNKLTPLAQKRGLFTDEDVFRTFDS